MSARAARALLICSALVEATVQGKSFKNFDGRTNDFSSPTYSAQHATVNGFNNEDRAKPYPVNNINPVSSSRSVPDGRPLPFSSVPIRHVSRIPPAPSSRRPYKSEYDPVSFYNNPTPYHGPWQPPITSNAPQPPRHYSGAPIIIHDSNNNPTPYLGPWQPPTTSNAPQPPRHYGGAPIIIHDSNNNPTPYLGPWQPPTTSNAPQPPRHYDGDPIIIHDSNNNPTPYLGPWQSPTTSNAPHPPTHYFGEPIIIHDSNNNPTPYLDPWQSSTTSNAPHPPTYYDGAPIIIHDSNNNPTPYFGPWQSPTTSNASQPPILYYCTPVIIPDSDYDPRPNYGPMQSPRTTNATFPPTNNDSGPLNNNTLEGSILPLLGIQNWTPCPNGTKRDILGKCRDEFQRQPLLHSNNRDCPKGFAKHPTGLCRKLVDFFG